MLTGSVIYQSYTDIADSNILNGAAVVFLYTPDFFQYCPRSA